MAELEHAYAEDNDLSTTNSQTFETVHSIPGSSLLANTKYLVVARCLLGAISATNNVLVRVQSDDDTALETKSESRYEMEQATSPTLKSWLFCHSFTTDASPADINLQVRGPQVSNRFCDQMSLWVLDLDQIGTEGTDYHEDINAATGTEIAVQPSQTTLAQITGPTLGNTQEWVVFGQVKIGIGSTGRYFRIRLGLAQDGTTSSTVNEAIEEGEDTDEERMVGVVGRHNAVGSPTLAHAQILAAEEANNGNMTDEGSYLIALPVSVFADFEFDFTPGTIGLASETTVASVGPYTPSVSGNHIIVGRLNINGGGALLNLHLEDGTTETRTGDSTPTHNQVWDGTKDQEAAYTFENISISAEKTYNLRGDRGAAQTVEYRWLLVLNMNEPAAAAGPFPRVQQTVVRM